MSASPRQRSALLIHATLACALTTVAAQQPRLPQLPAPPPMHLVRRVDRSELDGNRDPKARLRATMTLAEDHLKRAETLTDQKKYTEALSELGCYLGLLDDLRAFIATMSRDKGSTRDLYRHFEISIRPHVPRIAVMRRTTPLEYAVNLKDAEEYIKDARAEALDSFYGQTVLREKPSPESTPTPEGQKETPEALKRP
jgi:hypothetical protein